MLAFAAFLALAQTEFKPGSTPRWVSEGIDLGVRENVLPEYTNAYFSYRTREVGSRYEAAIHIHTAATKQLERVETALDGTVDDVERASLIRANALIPFYRRGAREFAREFRSLGVEGDFGIARLETLGARLARQSPLRTQPFRDVPSNHWAAKAVGDLRALGMLDGYPDGSFRG